MWIESKKIEFKSMYSIKKQLQGSNVIFLIWDTKCFMVGEVLRSSCKEFHIFGP